MFHTMRLFSLTLAVVELTRLATAQAHSCTANQPTVSAPHGNPWKALSEEETAGVSNLLLRRLNVTGTQGSSQDSYVVSITLQHSNKTDIVPYLDGNATSLNRYARATVMIGATNSTDSYWQEYMVGPLPATNASDVVPLTYPFNNLHPGQTKVHPIFSSTDGGLAVTSLSAQAENVTKAIWNTTIMGGVIGVRFGTPFWNEDGKIISWVLFFNNPDSSRVSSPTLLSLGVSAQVDLTSRDWQDWKVTAWYSRGEFYNSTEQFLSAVSSPDFEKPLPNVDGDWAATDQKGAPLPLDNLPPPVTVSQGSNRFKLDVQEDYVSWMDFTFYHSMAWDVGLSLFDINYKGKRLMYELSLQEALTHYAGSEPFASQTAFFDVNNGFGTTIQPLIRGYDCPAHATYLNTTFSEGNSTRTVPGAVCMFEYDSGYPIRRHSFSPGAPHTSVAKNIVFTVRTISTVGNYDFMIDYNFFYDGAVEVSARASGYVSATYWDGNSEYGFHIHDQLSGSLHDHTLTFKADLDILGTQNSVQKVEFVPTSTTYPWSQGRIHNTFKAERSFVDTETSINWAGNDAALYAIVNKDTPNRFGEYPGYRIKRSSGTTHLTVQNSTNIVKTGAYTTHDFYITKQKDVEPRLADPYNQFSLDDPLVDFAQFLDEESIEQQDLVLWFNLGMHHIPHTGDLPNTMFTAAHSSMRFEPLNYLEGDPSVASNQQVRVDCNEDMSVAFVEEFGKMGTMNGTC